MTRTKGKVFRVTDRSKEILQLFIKEPIAENIKSILVTDEGYLMFEEELPRDPYFVPINHIAMLSYYDFEYDA